ncbi:MAG: ABC transporter permease [Neomegalonema sp.]|nr:ABC transporter permease [Neomegalonema sp.]
MRVELVARREPSRLMLYLTPLLAVSLTALVGAGVFSLLGYDGPGAAFMIFVQPITNPSLWPDLAAKAAPLVIIAVGLAIGFRANVWNIGAEGQYVVGALAGTGVALGTWGMQGAWILPLMVLAGMLAGGLYAGVPALLRTRLGVSEILTSLMLNYAAIQLLYYLMRGPWKDPEGYGFPETRQFDEARTVPKLSDWGLLTELDPGGVVHFGAPLAILLALIAWFVMARSLFGFRIRVSGAAPKAARYGGFAANRTIWMSLLLSGGLAGLAGVLHASGSVGQMVPAFPTGYGFMAIIVAFLGRLHPLGVALASIVLAITIIGGEEAQAKLGMPNAAAGVFQAMTLFFLLATDVFVKNRLRIGGRIKTGASA